MTTFYTDLSQHDWDRAKGELNFSQIKSCTSGAVCIRATYGDPNGYHFPTYHFADMTRMAKSAGMTLLGAYHNLVRGDQASINRQVDWLRREMDANGSTWGMLDVERYEELMSSGMFPQWGDVQRFHDRWHAVEGRRLAFYIPDWVWDASLGRHSLTGLQGPIIASEYGSNPGGHNPVDLYRIQGGDSSDKWHAYGGRTPEILQYGSQCVVAGAGSNTDINAFRGTFDQLSALLGGDDVSAEEVWDHSLENGTNKTTLNGLQDSWARLDYLANKGGIAAQVQSAKIPGIGTDGKGKNLDAAVADLWKAVDDQRKKIDQILTLLQTNGGQPPTVVEVSDASVAKIADATADEIAADPERDGRDS